VKRIKILWVLHDSFNVVQRAHFLIERLANEYQMHITDFTVFRSPTEFVNIFKQIDSFRFYSTRTKHLIIHHLGKAQIFPLRYSKILRRLNERLSRKKIIELVKEQSIDIIVTSNCEFITPFHQAPVIFDYIDDHTAYFRDILKSIELANEIGQKVSTLLERSDLICTISHGLYREAERINKNVVLIPNGVDVKKFREAKRAAYFKGDPKIIGYVGNFGRFSGLLRLLMTIPIVTRSTKNLKYVIVGGGDQIGDAMRYVKRRKLEQYIIFLGRIPRNKIPGIIKSFDIGVVPFDKCQFTDNACPIKIFEYTAAGIPVVSTKLEEVKRLGFSNVFLAEDNVEDLSKRILQTLELEKIDIPWHRLKSYDWGAIALKFSQIIKNIVGSR